MAIIKDRTISIAPWLCLFFILICFLLIPHRLIVYHYLPPDDALRHAAKVISGKEWHDILVLSNDFKVDTHPGWHSILSVIHRATGFDQYGLVGFSIVVLFFIFCLIPLCLLELPEAWVLTLLVLSVSNSSFVGRLFLGRPYIFTMAVLLYLCYRWPTLKDARPSYRTLGMLLLLITLSTWIHGGSWYLFVIPIICFFLAGERKAGVRIAIASGIGILLGAVLAGHPFLFLWQNVVQAWRVFGSNIAPQALVTEFRPFNGDIVMLLIIGGIALWSVVRGTWNIKKVYNPVFLLVVVGWCMGFFVQRMWFDYSMPALCVWISMEFQEMLKTRVNKFSLSRVFITAILVTVVYAGFTSDEHYHWTERAATTTLLNYANPEHKKFLPEPGGIIYSDTMAVFYDTFFKNPRAPWRYILGFEPSWMPADDLKTYRNIKKFSRATYAEPWVKKMRPQDRFIVLGRPQFAPPGIAGLEWHYVSDYIWIGQVPQSSGSQSPATQ